MKTYIIALTAFLLIDMVWLGFVAKKFYAEHLGYLMTTQVNWIAAIIFYILFVSGLLVFVINPAILNNSWTHALVYGAFFGLVSYATYDLTNYATIKNWPLVVTVVDMIWGTTLGAVVSLITYFVVSK